MITPDHGTPTSDSYDRIPYPSYSYSQTNPDHLATLGILTGITPEPVEQSRILELGCASGGNLIPIAYELPGSQCLGVDFSSSAVGDAKETARKLEIGNVEFQDLDFMDIDKSLGQFDYIIAHGIFSWVSEDVRHKILSVCRELLSPTGIAYFSYNVYPGWHLYRIVRDFMFFHTRTSLDDRERIQSARSMVEYLAKSMPTWEPLLGQIFAHVQAQIKDSQDGYVRHDFLEEVNQPIYFSDFIRQANGHGLQYLANADLHSPSDIPDDVTLKIFEGVEGDVEIEQYLDFLRNRFFRQTLLCHQELAISRTIETKRADKLLLSSQISAPENSDGLYSEDVMAFIGPNNLTCSTTHPLSKAALIHLSVTYPKAVRFDELAAKAWEILSDSGAAEVDDQQKSSDEEILKRNVIQFYSQSLDLMRFHTFLPRFVTEAGDKPVASRTARHQALNQLPVTNLYHQGVTLDQFPRDLLSYLDGHHDRQDLLNVAVESVSQGLLEVAIDGQQVSDPQLLSQHLAPIVDQQLDKFAKSALLVG